MTEKKRKREPPLYLEMDPDEAFERFLGTDPTEVEELTKKGKKEVPSEAEASDGDSASSGPRHRAEWPPDSWRTTGALRAAAPVAADVLDFAEADPRIRAHPVASTRRHGVFLLEDATCILRLNILPVRAEDIATSHPGWRSSYQQASPGRSETGLGLERQLLAQAFLYLTLPNN